MTSLRERSLSTVAGQPGHCAAAGRDVRSPVATFVRLGRALLGIGDPDMMARLPFGSHGFTIRSVGEIAAALQNTGLQVDERRIDEKPMPRYLFIGGRD